MEMIDLDPGKAWCIPGGADLETLVDWELGQAKRDGRDLDAVSRLEERSRTDDHVLLLDIYQRLLELEFPPNSGDREKTV